MNHAIALPQSAATLTLIIAITLVHWHGLRGRLHGPGLPGCSVPVPRAATHTPVSCSGTGCPATRRPTAAPACRQEHPTHQLSLGCYLVQHESYQTLCKPAQPG